MALSLLLPLLTRSLTNSHESCTSWAEANECVNNPAYMQAECAKACAEQPAAAGELEQCAGWASQGECTRNPKFMMYSCPAACAAQRASVHEGLLDSRGDCVDVATREACASQPRLRESCEGTCATHALCEHDADAEECTRALRCRELKDDRASCKDSVASSGCANAAALLSSCFLSCARHDLNGTLSRYRAKVTVRTPKYGLIDERRRRPSLPCWHGGVFDPPPPAACANPRAGLARRWHALGTRRCVALRNTTPRAPPRRHVPLGASLGVGVGGGVRVLPVLLSPKVRLVEGFVSAEEAAHVIELGMPFMSRSLAGGRTESIRTSTTAMLPPSDPVVRRITERAAYLTGYPYGNVEPLQLLKYTAGQKYEPHFDFGEACDFEENMDKGHRHVTMLVYLNSVPDEWEGWTTFPKLNLKMSPRANAAVVFNDCHANGQEDQRTLHGGSPPTNGTKMAINIWIRAGTWRRG